VTHEEAGGNNTPRPERHIRLYASQLEALRAKTVCARCGGSGRGRRGESSSCGTCGGRGVLGPASGAERAVYECLLEHRNRKSGLAWPSARTIAEAKGLNRGTVQRSLRRLVSRGLIEATGRGTSNGTVRYLIPLPSTPPRTVEKASETTTQSAQESAHPRDRKRAPRATGSARITSWNEPVGKNYAAGISTSSQQPSACDLCEVDGFVTVTGTDGYRSSERCSHPNAAKREGAPVTLSESTVSETDRERLLTEMLQESKTVQRIEERL